MKTAKVTKRKKLKARIPRLVRQESWRYKRVKESWRKPRGVTSRVRRRRRGWPRMVSVGYKTPDELRHLHPSGLREVNVHRVEDLERLDPKICVARIGHTVGERKRVAILSRARELQIRIVNPGPARREEAPILETPVAETPETSEGEVQPETSQERLQQEA